MNRKLHKINGFTLIELLVVISIIGFLATASIVALNNARMRSRDAKRMADLTQLQKAVEMYVVEYSKPPIPTDYGESNTGGWDSSYEGDFMQFLEGTAGTANPRNIQFIASVPLDPINNRVGDCGSGAGYGYCYYFYSTGNYWSMGVHYRIGARLERTGQFYWVVNSI